MIACWVLAGILGVVVLSYVCLELHYFLRMCVTVILARYCKKRIHILDETAIYERKRNQLHKKLGVPVDCIEPGICTTTDIDTLISHMNNARYLRELDFARVDFYERTGLYREICAQGSGVVQGAATIRYRRFLRLFALYKITSKIIYWDDKSIFMEHRFVTPGDGFVRAIAICRQRVIDCSAEAIMGVLLDRGGKVNGGLEAGITPTTVPNVRPEIPPEVALWLESNEISSASLRPTPEVPRC